MHELDEVAERDVRFTRCSPQVASGTGSQRVERSPTASPVARWRHPRRRALGSGPTCCDTRPTSVVAVMGGVPTAGDGGSDDRVGCERLPSGEQTSPCPNRRATTPGFVHSTSRPGSLVRPRELAVGTRFAERGERDHTTDLVARVACCGCAGSRRRRPSPSSQSHCRRARSPRPGRLRTAGFGSTSSLSNRRNTPHLASAR